VWVWTRAVWNPVRVVAGGLWSGARWAGRGVRTVWLTVWRPVRAVWGAVATPILRATGSAMRRVRAWYRHEISEPVRAALRAARRDVRRALGGRRRPD
jgi:hypothetical protein